VKARVRENNGKPGRGEGVDEHGVGNATVEQPQEPYDGALDEVVDCDG
jgi:hypothetical protein